MEPVSFSVVMLCRALNLGFSDWACESIFDQADVDGNGTMNYQEFLHGFRAGVDAYGKENGVMYTFRDMKEAKESLAKKKDQVIMKYRIKWENTTLELERTSGLVLQLPIRAPALTSRHGILSFQPEAQRELKDLKERKVRLFLFCTCTIRRIAFIFSPCRYAYVSVATPKTQTCTLDDDSTQNES